jgi:hypothetical protein
MAPFFWRILVAAQLQGDLEVVGSQVVEVLHPTRDRVPETAVAQWSRSLFSIYKQSI